MTIKEIKDKRKVLEAREKELKKQEKILQAEFDFLQSICEHPNKETWTHYDYGGGSDYNEKCKDCGMHTCR